MVNSKFLAAAAVFSVCACIQAQTTFKTPQEAVRYYEELVGTLAGQVRQLQDDNAKLSGSVRDVKTQLEALARNNEVMSRDIAELRKQLTADAVRREKQLTALAGRPKAAANSSQNLPRTPAVTEYEEYVVQRGATLTAISKAYGVSVDAIKKANSMNSDVLRVGEKLKIPRK